MRADLPPLWNAHSPSCAPCTLPTRADGVPVFKGKPFMTSKGAMSSSIPNAWVK